MAMTKASPKIPYSFAPSQDIQFLACQLSPTFIHLNLKTIKKHQIPYLRAFIKEGVPDSEVGDGRDDINVHTQEPVEGEEGDVEAMASQMVA